MKKILTRKTLLSITSLVSVFFLLTACQSDKKELSEKAARTRTLEILNEIILVETEPESVELYYENNQKSIDSLQGQKGGTIIPEYKATWRADCSFAEGDDYQIVFNAVTGETKYYAREPEDWLNPDKTDENYADFQFESVGEYDEEDVKAASIAYCEAIGRPVKEVTNQFFKEDYLRLYQKDKWEGLFARYFMVEVLLKDETHISICLLADDLSVQAVWFTNN